MSDDSPTFGSQKLTNLVMGEGATATRQVVKLWTHKFKKSTQQHFIRLQSISKAFKVLV